MAGAVSYARLSIDSPLIELPIITKSLRNLRDRLARERSWLFADLGFAGLTDGEHLHLIVSHPGLSREQIVERLRKLWPKAALEDVPTSPVGELTPHLLALVGARQRGYQPLRFSISPRRSE